MAHIFLLLMDHKVHNQCLDIRILKKKKKSVWTLVYLVKIKETEEEDFKDLQPLNDLDNQSTTWV